MRPDPSNAPLEIRSPEHRRRRLWRFAACSAAMVPLLLAGCGGHGDGGATGDEDGGGTSSAHPLDFPAPTLLTPVTATSVVGAMPGTANVGGSGELSYELPLDVPDGMSGMQPHLSLHYSSLRGNGSLGRGWTLQGAGSAITLCRKTIASDGVTKGVRFDGTDDYCLDGQKLVSVTGVAGTEYRTEEDAVVRVVPAGSPPTTFQAFLKDGRIRTYVARSATRTDSGGTTSTVTPTWMLDSEQDRAGNSIFYTYSDYGVAGASERLLTRIDYGVRGETSRRSIGLVYETKPPGDAAVYDDNGMAYGSVYRLLSIQMFAPNPTAKGFVWSYSFTYSPGLLGHSLLASVEKKGALGSTLLKKEFDWQGGNVVYGKQATGTDAGGGPFTVVADFNGDGYDDVLTETTSWSNTQGAQEAWDTSYTHKIAFGGANGLGPASTVHSLDSVSLRHSRPVDFGGSGAIGILAFHWSDTPPSYCFPVNTIKTHHAASTSLTCAEYRAVTWSNSTADFVLGATPVAVGNNPPSNRPMLPATVVSTGTQEMITVADVNGDGLQDIVTHSPNTPTNGFTTWYARLSNGDGTFRDAIWEGTQNPMATAVCGPIVSDFDGDGRTDVAVPSSADCTTSQILTLDPGVTSLTPHTGFALRKPVSSPDPMSLTAHLADLNGDGLKDLIYVGADVSQGGCTSCPFTGTPYVFVAMNPGNFRFQPVAVQDPVLNYAIATFSPVGYLLNTGDVPIAIADVNRDGRDDLVLPGLNPTSPNWTITLEPLLSLGNNTFAQGPSLPSVIGPVQWPYQQPLATPHINVGHDFDGDGKADFFLEWNPLMTTSATILEASAQDVDLLSGVRNGDTPKTAELTVQYGRSTPSTTTCTFPEVCQRHGLPVVSYVAGLDVPDGLVYYRFDDARRDAQGRGFLGFGTMREWVPSRPMERTTTFDHATFQRLLSTTIPATSQFPAVYPGGIYPFAHRAATVMEVRPIVTHDAAWMSCVNTGVCGASAQPKSATARIRYYAATEAVTLTYGGTAYFPYTKASETKTWEAGVNIDWTLTQPLGGYGTTPHIPVGAIATGEAVLRDRLGSYTVDAYRNILSSTEYTVGGVHDERTVAFDYHTPSSGSPNDWILDLPKTVQARSYTEGASPLPPFSDTEYTYDNRGLPTLAKIEPSGTPDVNETITYNFDFFGRLGSWIATTPSSPNARSETYAYADVSGEGIYPSSVTDGAGLVYKMWIHPAFGDVWAAQDPNGANEQIGFDDLGRVVTEHAPSGAVSSFTYSPNLVAGKLAGTAVLRGSSSGACAFDVSDEHGRSVSESYSTFAGGAYAGSGQCGGGSTVTHAYDWFGRLVSTSNPDSSTAFSTVQYDSLDRALAATAADGSAVTATHTFFNSTTTDASELKRVSQLQRDRDGRVLKSLRFTSGASVGMTYTYGANDRVKTISDGTNSWSFQWDIRGRRTQASDPDAGTQTFQLNGFDELAELDTPSGDTILARDADGRVVQTDGPDGTRTFTWDNQLNGLGELGTEISPDARIDYAFDAIGRIQSKSYKVAGATYAIGLGYDTIGRLSTIAYPQVQGRAPFVATYQYNNPQGYLSEIDATKPDGSSSLAWKVTGRNAHDELTGATFGNNVTDTRTYDPLMLRLQTAKVVSTPFSATFANKTYTYFTDGNVKSIADAQTNRTESYVYDNLSRLQSWTLASGGTSHLTTYGYDAGELGNLVDVNRDGVDEHSVYGGPSVGNRPHAVASKDGVTYQYDVNGRVSGDSTGRTIAYDMLDLPTTITASGGGSTTFGYTAGGERVLKSGPSGTTVSIGQLYEKRVGAAPGGGDLHVFFVDGPEGRVAQVVYDAGASTEKREYLHSDALGSLSLVTDDLGKLSASQYHDPFGKRVDANGVPTGPTGDVRGAFATHDHDDELGLINMKGRIYDPSLRRFLSPDPFVSEPLDIQSFNRYSYVRNDPTNRIDPTGFADCDTESCEEQNGDGDSGGEGDPAPDPDQEKAPEKPPFDDGDQLPPVDADPLTVTPGGEMCPSCSGTTPPTEGLAPGTGDGGEDVVPGTPETKDAGEPPGMLVNDFVRDSALRDYANDARQAQRDARIACGGDALVCAAPPPPPRCGTPPAPTPPASPPPSSAQNDTFGEVVKYLLPSAPYPAYRAIRRLVRYTMKNSPVAPREAPRIDPKWQNAPTVRGWKPIPKSYFQPGKVIGRSPWRSNLPIIGGLSNAAAFGLAAVAGLSYMFLQAAYDVPNNYGVAGGGTSGAPAGGTVR